MKSKHITSFVVAITLLMVFPAALRAQTESESIIPSELGFTNSGPVLSILGTNCTVFFDQGSNRYGNRPRYYSNGEAIRLYAGNEMSVETSGSNRIVSIQITFATGGSNIPMTATPGSFDGTTWRGSTNEVVFSVGGTSGHRRVKKLDITYATGVEPPVISGTTPFASSTTATITVASGAANGTTIHYTTNGATPTENSTQYSNPIAINATTTIKAIARYNNVNSSVATMTFVSDANNWGGSGTQADPFLITNTTKMNDLASLVNGGKSYRGVYFRLDADLTYTGSNNYTPIGKPGYPFDGTFDGNGHSISGIDISTAGTTDADSYKGIFGQVGDYGTVRNLTLSNSTIDAYNHTGGIVGYNWGTIENCHVSSTVTIHSHLGGSHGQGGIVGTNSNYVYGCTSAANITMSDGLSSVTGRGGIAGENSFHSSVGYSNSISNCLYLGDNVQGTSDYGTIIGDVSADLISSYPIYCYYTLQTSGLHALGGSDYGTCQEAYTLTSGTVGLSLLCDGALPNPDYVEQYGDYINGDLYNATLTYGGLIYSPSGQTVTFSLAVPDNYSYSGVTASAGTLTDNGDGTFSLTMPAANVTITATLEGLPWSGSGTENDPYIISTVAEYNSFANRVSGGVGIAQNCFNGMYFQLVENLNVSTMVGSSETNCFKGVFDGDGHTLTVSLNNNGQGVAPFHYISGATIKNLVVAGSVTATDLCFIYDV